MRTTKLMYAEDKVNAAFAVPRNIRDYTNVLLNQCILTKEEAQSLDTDKLAELMINLDDKGVKRWINENIELIEKGHQRWREKG